MTAAPQATDALTVANLSIGTHHRELVHGISFQVGAGERVALIGESGSGKTLTAAAIMGLLPENLYANGTISVGNVPNILALTDNELSEYRGRLLAMVFQEPMTALDPLMRVGKQLAEAFALHQFAGGAQAALAEVGLPPETYRAYPHQLSGGQRQRVLIAMAMANHPAFLLADEPTTALDATVQSQVLELLGNLVKAHGTGLLFITHDLGVVAKIAERVYVMQDGVIVESGPVAEVLTKPQHPYTQSLIAASDLTLLNNTVVEAPGTGGQSSLRSSTPSIASDAERERWYHSAQSAYETTTTNSVVDAPGTVTEATHPAVVFRDVTKTYQRSSWRGANRKATAATDVPALRGISFTVNQGERFGIVGESGSGKTTTLKIIAGLETADSGIVQVLDQLLTTGTAKSRSSLTAGTPQQSDSRRANTTALATVRSQVALVFQDPKGSLDPRMKIGDTVIEPLLNPIVQQRIPQAATRAGRTQLMQQALASVGLPADTADAYPHQFSGGQRQRISIARALISQPQILIADEPVSALDVSVRAQVLQLLLDQVAQRNLTMVLVSHDLGVIQSLCDRVAVMQNGVIVEQGTTTDVWANPQHSYTRQLQAAAI